MKRELIELWNVRDGVPAYIGAQRIVNVLGRLKDPENINSLSYSLNGGPWEPVFIKNRNASANRLAKPGDFNIDTIDREQLKAENRLALKIRLKDGTQIERIYNFLTSVSRSGDNGFHLEMGDVNHAQEIGQLVDGRWRVGKAENGERCLEIVPEDAGLDRIILFGNDIMQDSYTVRARLRVNQWLRPLHSVGLLFKWNPHLQGDGTWPSSEWSTGLGYYYSHCKGLRVRVGVNVRLNEQGEKLGDSILGENILSPGRYWLNRIYKKLTGGNHVFPQVVAGRQYWFELKVHPQKYIMTVWSEGCTRPSPQVVVENPSELLKKGAVGIIAHYCAIQVFEFNIELNSRMESTQ